MAEYIVYGNEGWVSSVVNGELIRCRECRYYGTKVRIHDTYVCNKHGIYVPENGYCSEGKTK